MPATALRITVGHAVGKTAVFIGPLPPLAGLVGEVAVLRQHFNKARVLVERFTLRHIQLSTLILPVDIVAGNPMLEGVKPRHHRCQ